MKANELFKFNLMIGDWVFFATRLTKINGIAEGGFSVNLEHEGWQSISAIEPIPLTAEILEKNGFKFDGSGQRSMMLISGPHFSEGIRYNIYVGLKKKTIEVFVAHPVEKSPNWRKSNKVYLEVCGLYVHELQHALRLCGIEKEIEL